MADLKEILGDEELAQQVEDSLGDEYLIVEEENHVTKKSFNEEREKLQGQIETLEETKEDLQSQIESRDQQLEQLKNDTQASDELKQRIEELEQQNEQTQEEMQEKIQQREQELQSQLTRTKKEAEMKVALKDAKYPDLLMKNVDFEELELDDDGNVKNVDNVVENLQQNYEDLFGKETVTGNEPETGGGSPEPTPDENEMSDAEWFAMKENEDN